MEHKFKRQIESLDEVFSFLHDFFSANGIDESIIFTVDLVVEELFTNLVKYDSKNTNDISICLRKNENKLIISLIDFDAKPFDLTKTEEVDVGKPLENRKIGGLGIHLVKKMVDELNYEYLNRQSRITFTKILEK